MSEHYAYVRRADPVGLCEMYEGYCTRPECGWVGPATDDERLAEEHVRRHRLNTWVPSQDDIGWLTGTGRWSQD